MTYEKQKQQFKIEVYANEIVHVKDDEFEGAISATFTRGNRAAAGQEIQFYLAGRPLEKPLKTDENGKAVRDFSITTAAKTISIEAQAVGFSTNDKRFIDLPRPEKPKGKTKKSEDEKKIGETKTKIELKKLENQLKSITEKGPEPYVLVVVPRRVGNHIILYIRVIDELDRGIKDAKITIVDSSKTGLQTEKADEDGEKPYDFDLQPDEEREICITAAGFGDREYRHTFRGRRLQ